MGFGSIKLKQKPKETSPVVVQEAKKKFVKKEDLPEELMVMHTESVKGLLVKPGGLKPVLNEIKELATSFSFDVETEQGRKDIKALAMKVSRSKTYIEGIGKEIVGPWQSKKKAVDKERKYSKDFLDKLRDEIKAPLVEWDLKNNPKEEELIEGVNVGMVKLTVEKKLATTITKMTGLDETTSMTFVQAIAQGKVPNLSIKY